MKKFFIFVSSLVLCLLTFSKNEKPQKMEMPRITPVLNLEELEFAGPIIDTSHFVYSRVKFTDLSKK